MPTYKVMVCPNIARVYGDDPKKNPAGVELGFNYLGGHGYYVDLPPWKVNWQSPQTTHEKSTNGEPLALFCDLNQFLLSKIYGYEPFTTAQHTSSGGRTEIDPKKGVETVQLYSLGGKPPGEVGAQGGNVVYLDGSAHWLPMKKMREHQAYDPFSRIDWRAYW